MHQNTWSPCLPEQSPPSFFVEHLGAVGHQMQRIMGIPGPGPSAFPPAQLYLPLSGNFPNLLSFLIWISTLVKRTSCGLKVRTDLFSQTCSCWYFLLPLPPWPKQKPWKPVDMRAAWAWREEGWRKNRVTGRTGKWGKNVSFPEQAVSNTLFISLWRCFVHLGQCFVPCQYPTVSCWTAWKES